jgi:hypothetical protein
MNIDIDSSILECIEKCTCLPAASSDDWQALLQLLKLPLDYLGSVYLVISQGRWREANDPVRYIRAAARQDDHSLERPKRSEVRVKCIADLKLPRDADGTLMTHDEALDRLNIAPSSGEWDTCFAQERVHRKFLLADSREEDAFYTVEWEDVMDVVQSIAGLNKTRRDTLEKVLIWRSMMIISREQLLTYPQEAERKKLGAAWKWIDRNPALLTRVLSSGR